MGSPLYWNFTMSCSPIFRFLLSDKDSQLLHTAEGSPIITEAYGVKAVIVKILKKQPDGLEAEEN